MSVSPATGSAFSTLFSLSTVGWTYFQGPLKYQYFIKTRDGTKQVVTGVESSATLSMMLPPCNKVIIKVQDFYGAEAETELDVTITLDSSDSSAVDSQLQDLENQSDQEKVQTIGSVASALNDIDASFPSTE